ncbi:hypothetical protein E2C01_024753 [Portunus trituberculatus]|uniref:Uncharacterized protein n=1 Tax=Portunus trituberculatus TaxID=210409 RepID=A0A5B7EG03_PORTR|nr:hypothetical protein [Portunus trituberculatus]
MRLGGAVGQDMKNKSITWQASRPPLRSPAHRISSPMPRGQFHTIHGQALFVLTPPIPSAVSDLPPEGTNPPGADRAGRLAAISIIGLGGVGGSGRTQSPSSHLLEGMSQQTRKAESLMPHLEGSPGPTECSQDREHLPGPPELVGQSSPSA